MSELKDCPDACGHCEWCHEQMAAVLELQLAKLGDRYAGEAGLALVLDLDDSIESAVFVLADDLYRKEKIERLLDQDAFAAALAHLDSEGVAVELLEWAESQPDPDGCEVALASRFQKLMVDAGKAAWPEIR